MPEIIVPRPGWSLRPYQVSAWRATAVNARNAAITWHRRAGKDELLLNALAVQALRRPASYAYMFPENLHARRAMWQAVNPHTGKRRILETFPAEMMAAEPNETEMRLSLVNGSMISFFGSDNYDRMVGASLAGIISSEHALSHPSAYAFFSPMLRENGGWFWAISTPRGRNHFKGLMDHASRDPRWFSEVLSIHDTDALAEGEIEDARREAEQAIARLNRAQSTEAYQAALNDLIDVLKVGMDRARGRAGVGSPPPEASDDDLLRKYGG